MGKMKLHDDIEASTAIEVAVDKIFEDRLYEFTHELMLEAEDDVEELFDVTSLEKNLDSGERWCDSLRDDTRGYIIDKLLKYLR